MGSEQENKPAVDVEGFYRKYAPMILRRCRTLLKDEEEAVDAMQDVFVQVLRHRDRLTGEAPSSLLYRIATNVCLNRLRARRRHPEHKDNELLAEIAALDSPEERPVYRRVLDRLFRNEQESTCAIAVMHFVDGMTLEEVARESKLSVSGVRRRLRVLRARLVEIEGGTP